MIKFALWLWLTITSVPWLPIVIILQPLTYTKWGLILIGGRVMWRETLMTHRLVILQSEAYRRAKYIGGLMGYSPAYAVRETLIPYIVMYESAKDNYGILWHEVWHLICPHPARDISHLQKEPHPEEAAADRYACEKGYGRQLRRFLKKNCCLEGTDGERRVELITKWLEDHEED